MKKVLVCGAGGFIGSHLVKRLKGDGFHVVGADLKQPEFEDSYADSFIIGDLRNQVFCEDLFSRKFDEVYQLAADMGGAGYVFSGDNDADVMYNSSIINLNVLNQCRVSGVQKVFYSSSACIYPAYNQQDPHNPMCREDSVYPASPDSEYGWEKLFSERLYLNFMRNHGLRVCIARFHNIFGPYGAWQGGREKAIAALCRKVAQAKNGDYIEVWGDGKQTRSFLYIDECLEGIRRLMDSEWEGPVNIGSEELISINDLAHSIIKISGKELSVKNISGPTGVRGRNSDNTIIQEKLHWAPNYSLQKGLQQTYNWISARVEAEDK